MVLNSPVWRLKCDKIVILMDFVLTPISTAEIARDFYLYQQWFLGSITGHATVLRSTDYLIVAIDIV